VLQSAARLTEADRLKLIRQLQSLAGAPEGIAELEHACKSHKVWLRWDTLIEIDKARARRICERLATYFDPVMTLRQRATVLAAIVRQSMVAVRQRGKVITHGALLQMLDDEDWNLMLERAFPGYPIATLGAILCGSLTGSRSAKRTASSTDHEERT
jgi:hypothetical protein